MRIHEASRAYLSELARRCSQPTVRLAGQVLSRFLRRLAECEVSEVEGVSEEHLVSFLAGLASLSLGTRRLYLGIVRRFFAFLLARGLVLLNPAAELVIREGGRLPRRVPSEAGVRRLLAHTGTWRLTAARDRALVEILYGTGLRVGECARLDLSDLDLSEGTLLVRSGKGRRDRVVPLLGRARAVLDAYLRDHRARLLIRPEPALFISERGGRLGARSIAKVIARAARLGGLSCSPHSLRHACATHLLRHGASVRRVQDLLGHRRLATTSVYTQVTTQDLRQVLSRCHPRERRRSGPR